MVYSYTLDPDVTVWFQYGRIEEMNVCDNLGDHLVGNVYIKVGDCLLSNNMHLSRLAVRTLQKVLGPRLWTQFSRP